MSGAQAAPPGNKAADAAGARGGVGGPGRWCCVDLAHRFVDLVGPGSVPDAWVWRGQRTAEPSSSSSSPSSRPPVGEAGGWVAPERRHATVLLRLDTELSLGVLREVAERTEPFTVTATRVYLKPVHRITREFGEPVHGVGVELHSPELVAFRDRFVETLRERIASDVTAGVGGGTVSKGAVAAPSTASLKALHDPYDNRRGGHASLVYLRGDEATLAAARAMQADANARLESGDADRTVAVESLRVVGPGGAVEVVPLGGHVPLEERAISLTGLERFCEAHAGAIGPTVATADVVRRIIVPETRRLACSYAAHAASEAAPVGDGSRVNTDGGAKGSPGAPQRSIGRVDFFVSHAWSYPFLDLVAAIRAHHSRHAAGAAGKGEAGGAGSGGSNTSDGGADVFYWLDIFAVNQHNVHSAAELPKLRDAITASRALVVVLTPWERPLALTRIWCLYEVLQAMNASTPVAVQMPPGQQAAFTAELARDFSAIRLRLCEIDSANARATQPADLRQIRRQIESTVGYNALNVLVKDQIRAWLLGCVMSRLDADLAALEAVVVVGGGAGEAHDAGPSSDGVASYDGSGGKANAGGATGGGGSSGSSDGGGSTGSSVGNTSSQGDATAAACDWVHTVALFLGEFGKLTEAQRLYEAVLRARLASCGRDHPATVAVTIDLAFLLAKVGRAPDAERLLREQVGVLEALLLQAGAGDGTGADPGRETGAVAAARPAGAPEQTAHAQYGASMSARFALTRKTASAAVGAGSGGGSGDGGDDVRRLRATLLLALNNLAMAVGSQGPGRHDEALAIYRRVLADRNELHGSVDNEDSVATTNNMAWLLAKMGRSDEAEPLLARVLAFRRERYGPNNPSALNAAQNLGTTLHELSRYDDAAALLEDVAKGKLENLGAANVSTLKALVALAECLSARGDADGARAWADRAGKAVDALVASQGAAAAPRGVVERLRKLGASC